LPSGRTQSGHRQSDRDGQIECKGYVVGLHFLPQALGNHPHRVLGRRIDQAAGTDLVTGDGRDVDEVFCAFMYGSAAAIP
jgi:hypothetical protein